MSNDDFIARMEAKAKAALPVDVGFAPLVPLTTEEAEDEGARAWLLAGAVPGGWW